MPAIDRSLFDCRYSMRTANLFPEQHDCGDMQCHGIEDPSNVWKDARGNFHAVFHDHMMIGGHAYSSDGLSWRYSTSPCFGPSVEFIDSHNGSSTAWLARRERPHVVLDDTTGAPIALSSGVQEGVPVPGWATDKGLGSDRTYTLVVRF